MTAKMNATDAQPSRDGSRRAEQMGFERPGFGTDPASVRRRLETMEKVLERSFVVPGINRPVGLDAVAGLVPVFGDLMTAAVGAWLVWEARALGMPRWQLWRMAANVGVDTVLGAVPLVGDVFDLFFRSNTRNLRIVKRHLDRHHPATGVIDR